MDFVSGRSQLRVGIRGDHRGAGELTSRSELVGAKQPSPVDNGDSPVIKAAIARAQGGDIDALHFLYANYAGMILRFVRSIVHDHHEAEDITQNVFMKLMRVIGKYEPREVPFAAWILKVARNVALDHLRSRRTTPSEDIEVIDDDRGQVGRDRSRDFFTALERLTEEQRDVLILRHVIGLSPLEIAELLGKSETSIHGLHHRGRLSIQSALTELEAAPVVAQS